MSIWRSARPKRPAGDHPLHSDSGNAIVEFVVLAVGLLIPIVYLVLTLAQIQSAMFAVDSAARYVARIEATEADPARRESRINSAIDSVSRDYGVPRTSLDFSVHCTGAECPEAGSVVVVRVSAGITLPGLGFISPGASIANVNAEHSLIADETVGDGSSE